MSLIEVASGNIVDSESTVPLSNVIDVLASRDFEVEYINTKGRTLIVSVAFLANSPTIDASALTYMRINNVSGALGARDQWLGGKRYNADTSVGQELFSGTVLVPPGYYYNLRKIELIGGTVALRSWVESW